MNAARRILTVALASLAVAAPAATAAPAHHPTTVERLRCRLAKVKAERDAAEARFETFAGAWLALNNAVEVMGRVDAGELTDAEVHLLDFRRQLAASIEAP